MGSARVQYELERTLPAIQLAAQHAVFDRDTEVRSITHKRRQFENALVRHSANVDDFLAYIEYEEKLMRLQSIRIQRLVELEDIPRQDVHKLQNQAKSHLISIYERGVRRLRHHTDLWLRYLQWAKDQKMRSAVSKISARALALFPRNISLWLAVADYELNENLSADTARALLQRAIRINSITHTHAAEAVRRQRPQKRSKKGNSEVLDESIRPTGDEKLDRPHLILRPDEIQLIHLWVEYVRMELVFLERLRRRRAVLDILDHKKGQAELPSTEEDGLEVLGKEADEPQPSSIQQIVAEERTEQVSEGAASIVLGAIPIAILNSAVSLTSTSSLPPVTHFAFLLAISALFNRFPFQGDAKKLRQRLNGTVETVTRQRYEGEAIPMLFICSSPILTAQNEAKASVQDDEEAMATLSRASRLSLEIDQCREITQLFDATSGVSGTTSITASYMAVEKLAEVVTAKLDEVEQKSVVAILTRDVLKSMQKRFSALSAQSDLHVSVQITFIQALRLWASEAEMGEEFEHFLDAFADRVWKDARAKGVDGVYMSFARLSQEMRSARNGEDVKEVVKEALSQHANATLDETRFLRLAAEGVERASQDGLLTARTGEQLWKQILQSKGSERDQAVWQAWCNALPTGVPQRQQRLLGALEQHYDLEADVRQTIVDHLFAEDGIAKARSDIESWCSRQGASGVDVLRRLIDVDCDAYRQMQETDDAQAAKPTAAARIRSSFELLLRHSALVSDAISCLRFLYNDLGNATEASVLFDKLSRTFSKSAPDSKITLEDEWRRLITDMEN